MSELDALHETIATQQAHINHLEQLLAQYRLEIRASHVQEAQAQRDLLSARQDLDTSKRVHARHLADRGIVNDF